MKGLAHWFKVQWQALRLANANRRAMPLTRGDVALAEIMRECCERKHDKERWRHARIKV